MNIFSYMDYSHYIADSLKARGKIHGSKKKLAEAANCQPSYLSLVLRNKAHLTLEQAKNLCQHWRLAAEETDYFLLLVCYSRAGTLELKNYYREKLKTLKADRENLRKRIRSAETFPDSLASVYYSSWIYMAIHLLITIKEFQLSLAIADRLQISEESVLQTLHELEKMGFARQEGKRWVNAGQEYHLPRESRFVILHHANWRRRAVDNSLLKKSSDIHFTSVSSLSKADIEKVRELILGMIDSSREVIGPSHEEELVCFSVDFFEV